MKTTDLSSFSNPEYHHGKSLPVRLVWMLVSRIFFQTVLPYPSAFKADQYSMSIPMHNRMTQEDFEYIVYTLKSIQ